MVFDPRSEDALIIVCANLFGTVISDSLSKESGDVVRLHSIYRSADELNFHSIFVSNLFRVLTDLFRKRRGETETFPVYPG